MCVCNNIKRYSREVTKEFEEDAVSGLEGGQSSEPWWTIDVKTGSRIPCWRARPAFRQGKKSQSIFQEQAPSSKLKKSHEFANVNSHQQIGREHLEGAKEELRWGDASHRHELVSHSEVCARVTSDKTILELKIEAT